MFRFEVVFLRRSSRLSALTQHQLSPRALRALKRQNYQQFVIKVNRRKRKQRRRPSPPPSLSPRIVPSQSPSQTPKERETNIWKLACQERVDCLFRRYGKQTIRAVVASQSPSPRFKLYTPASYTSPDADPDDMDMDTDSDEDYDEESMDDPSVTLSFPSHPQTPAPSLPPIPRLSVLPVAILAEPRSPPGPHGTPPDPRRAADWASSPHTRLFLPEQQHLFVDQWTEQGAGSWTSFLQALLAPGPPSFSPPPFSFSPSSMPLSLSSPPLLFPTSGADIPTWYELVPMPPSSTPQAGSGTSSALSYALG